MKGGGPTRWDGVRPGEELTSHRWSIGMSVLSKRGVTLQERAEGGIRKIQYGYQAGKYKTREQNNGTPMGRKTGENP